MRTTTSTAAPGVSCRSSDRPRHQLCDGTVSAVRPIYYVRTNDLSANSSPLSLPDLATTIFFTDPTLTVGSTPFKPVHITELRTAVDAVRTLAGLAPGSYTDATITAGSTRPVAAHITDLRTALNAARSALGLPALSYNDPTVVANSTRIRAVHILEPHGSSEKAGHRPGLGRRKIMARYKHGSAWESNPVPWRTTVLNCRRYRHSPSRTLIYQTVQWSPWFALVALSPRGFPVGSLIFIDTRGGPPVAIVKPTRPSARSDRWK